MPSKLAAPQNAAPRRITQLIMIRKTPVPEQYEAILEDSGGQRYMFPVYAPYGSCYWLRQAAQARGAPLRGESPAEAALLQTTQFGPPDSLGRVHTISIHAENELRTAHEVGLTVVEAEEGREDRISFVVPVGICNQINQWLVSY